jgi:8-oxo-dGTP pyrophosphatase MutT (NUDIX family)
MKTSVGIICYKLDTSIYNKFINNLQQISYYDINHLILNNIDKFKTYDNYIKFLLVKRRYSLNYIDFIRGKYNINDFESIYKMFSYMSQDEIDAIKNNDFNTLWYNLWLKNAYKKKYSNEMTKSNKQFDYLKSINFFTDIKSEYLSTEWEIPKGGKKNNETNINCALREFKEETSLDNSDIKIVNCIDPIHDIFTGTNYKEYRHIFYTAVSNIDTTEDIYYNNEEIANVQWVKWSELNNIIRPYNNSKITILTLIFLFIINICENYRKIDLQII